MKAISQELSVFKLKGEVKTQLLHILESLSLIKITPEVYKSNLFLFKELSVRTNILHVLNFKT